MSTCAVEVRRGDDWHPRREPCGKPAKGTLADGTDACGVHLGVERRKREQKDAQAAWEARVDAVNDALGIDAHGWAGPGQSLSVRLSNLERLAFGESRGCRSYGCMCTGQPRGAHENRRATVSKAPLKEEASCCLSRRDEHNRLPVGFCSSECVRRVR